jgi:hypothetical protein
MLTKADGIYYAIPPQQDDGDDESARLITGRNLAHSKRSIQERAFVGAGLHLSNLALVLPTVKQSACLAGVCVPYVAAAVAVATIPDDGAARAAVLAGKVTLLDAAKAVAPESLAQHFARATPEEWLECARMVGPSAIWDRMVAPLVT